MALLAANLRLKIGERYIEYLLLTHGFHQHDYLVQRSGFNTVEPRVKAFWFLLGFLANLQFLYIYIPVVYYILAK